MDIRKELVANRDEKYAAFTSRLVDTESPILGVRLPVLRDIAKRIAKGDWEGYLDNWHCECMEDVMLKGFVISYAKMDLDRRLSLFAEHVDSIDNWSTCDSFCSTWKPKKSEKEKAWEFILPFMESGKEFHMRYAIVMMLDHFIDDAHIDDILGMIDCHHHDGYYYRMAVAWNLSVCFIKFPERTMSFLKGDNSLDDWTFNKTIQKVIESYRVDNDTKSALRAMKRIRNR